jgi:hypothetical protein
LFCAAKSTAARSFSIASSFSEVFKNPTDNDIICASSAVPAIPSGPLTAAIIPLAIASTEVKPSLSLAAITYS